MWYSSGAAQTDPREPVPWGLSFGVVERMVLAARRAFSGGERADRRYSRSSPITRATNELESSTGFPEPHRNAVAWVRLKPMQ